MGSMVDDAPEPKDAEHGDVPEDLLTVFEVLEWEAAQVKEQE